MKKLMFTVAVLMAGIAVADIQSSNIVGYQNVAAKADAKKYIGCTFEKLDGSAVTLGDFGVNADFAPAADMLTLLNQYGGPDGEYIYINQELCDAYNDGTGFSFVPGWYDYYEFSEWSGEETLPNYNSRELYDGEAAMIQASSDDAALVFAGQVGVADAELFCKADQKCFLCNCTPVDLTLGDILVNEDFAPASDQLTILNQFGGPAGEYIYINQELCDAYNDGTGFSFVPGWYDYYEFSEWSGEETLPNYNSTAIPAGMGFMIQASSDDAAIIIPSAL